jgi:hypothetical protein
LADIHDNGTGSLQRASQAQVKYKGEKKEQRGKRKAKPRQSLRVVISGHRVFRPQRTH